MLTQKRWRKLSAPLWAEERSLELKRAAYGLSDEEEARLSLVRVKLELLFERFIYDNIIRPLPGIKVWLRLIRRYWWRLLRFRGR
jgi:hypothetical protein